MNFRAYSTHDFAIVNHLQYPRVPQVFHEVPVKYRSGRLRHSWTHHNITAILGHPATYKVKQYATECMRTFRAIPDYEIFSASEYGKTHSISHVTAKKRLLEACKRGDEVIQITPKFFARCSGEISRQFVIKIKALFDSQVKYSSKHQANVVQSNLTLPSILRRLQDLKEYALTHKYAFYKNIAKVVGQPMLSWLISNGVCRRIQLDFVKSRASVVYLCYMG